MRWIAIFSQTGSEICNLIERGYVPTLVMTNSLDNWDPRLYKVPVYHSKNKDILWKAVRDYAPDLVTLHGYMQIIPAEYCEDLNIINGHPGDIVLFPDQLTGKDPQKKAIECGLTSTGVVIHKATSVVDHGPVLGYRTHDIAPGTTTEQLIKELKVVQLDLWSEILEDML